MALSAVRKTAAGAYVCRKIDRESALAGSGIAVDYCQLSGRDSSRPKPRDRLCFDVARVPSLRGFCSKQNSFIDRALNFLRSHVIWWSHSNRITKRGLTVQNGIAES